MERLGRNATMRMLIDDVVQFILSILGGAFTRMDPSLAVVHPYGMNAKNEWKPSGKKLRLPLSFRLGF